MTDTLSSGNATTTVNGRTQCSRLTLARQSTASRGPHGSTGLFSPQEPLKAKLSFTLQDSSKTRRLDGRRFMSSSLTSKVSMESAGVHPRSQQFSHKDRTKTANRQLAANSSHLPSDWSQEETITKLTSGSSMTVLSQQRQSLVSTVIGLEMSHGATTSASCTR